MVTSRSSFHTKGLPATPFREVEPVDVLAPTETGTRGRRFASVQTSRL